MALVTEFSYVEMYKISVRDPTRVIIERYGRRKDGGYWITRSIFLSINHEAESRERKFYTLPYMNNYKMWDL